GFGIMKRAVNENVVIRYNISENDDTAIYFFGFNNRTGMTKALIYNNTHFIKAGIKLSVFGSGGAARTAFNTDFYNNIFYFEEPGSNWGQIGSMVNFSNNCFYNISPKGENYTTSNPLFVNPNEGISDIEWSQYPNVLTGYQLKQNSPLIGIGKIIDNNGGKDFWGNPLYNNNPDIGAFEYPN
ncbi:MAG: hypothetical protein CMC89_03110, partial [Flavobacteriaceae bacterium]|nr:hypothetical protein [Flavobacteriaceae bacterium]